MSLVYYLKNHNTPSYDATLKVLRLFDVKLTGIKTDSRPGTYSYLLLPAGIIHWPECILEPDISLVENIARAGRVTCSNMKNRFLLLVGPYQLTQKNIDEARKKGLDIATDLASLLRMIVNSPMPLRKKEIEMIKETLFEKYLKSIKHDINSKRIDTLLPKLKKCLILAVQKNLIKIEEDIINTICIDEAIDYLSPLLKGNHKSS